MMNLLVGLNHYNKIYFNHFIPFTEEDVGANGRFESDFMVQYLKDKKLSPEVQVVLNEGKKLWHTYFKIKKHSELLKETYKLNRPDVGWYQIRKTLESSEPKTDFTEFENAYKQLTEKLSPLVYEYGFLLE